MKKTLLYIILFLISSYCFSQDFNVGAITLQELSNTVYEKDSTASAVVLQEFGNSWITATDRTDLFFEYHIKIKILSNKGIENGNVIVPLSKSSDGTGEKISNVSGWTYFLNDAGGLEKTPLDEKKSIC